MDTYTGMSYDKFLVVAVKNNFQPMLGGSIRNDRSRRMDDEYYISANLNQGLLLVSESKNNILYESKLYYELNIPQTEHSGTIDRILDILEESKHVSCNEQSTFAIEYNAEEGLIAHLRKLNNKELCTNNPWKYFGKHNITIWDFNFERTRIGYYRDSSWIKGLPKEAQQMIGYRK